MIGQRIKKIRISRKLTQNQLAQRIGVSKQTISNWENDNQMPELETFIVLAKDLQCSADYILGFSTVEKVNRNNNCIYIDLDKVPLKWQKHIKETTEQLIYTISEDLD